MTSRSLPPSNLVFDLGYLNTALTHFTDNVLLNVDSGRLTGAVLLDLSKAFDTVDHNLLLYKLNSVGLSDDTVNWLQARHTSRTENKGRLSEIHSLSLRH